MKKQSLDKGEKVRKPRVGQNLSVFHIHFRRRSRTAPSSVRFYYWSMGLIFVLPTYLVPSTHSCTIRVSYRIQYSPIRRFASYQGPDIARVVVPRYRIISDMHTRVSRQPSEHGENTLKITSVTTINSRYKVISFTYF